MTPGERAVIAAAEDWAAAPQGDYTAAKGLRGAVIALQAECEAKTPAERAELDNTYGQIVEGDQLWSRTGRWFDVSASVNLDGGQTRVTMPAIGNVKAKPPRPPYVIKSSDTPCRVRRGKTGQAVDLFATVMWSGAGGYGTAREVDMMDGPTFAEHDPATDPEASESED